MYLLFLGKYMNSGKTIFSQIMDFIPKYQFDKIVDKYKGDFRTRSFSCWDQFLTMCFAQLTYRDSLRDIEACLNAQPQKLYHMGIKGHVNRTNLSNANENRDWRIYAEFAQILIHKARRLYKDDNDFSIELENTVYAFDSTTIKLCLALFTWARFRKKVGAVKLHTLLDLRGSIPTFIAITDGKVHDVNILDILEPENNAFYVMDRGYIDFERLYKINQASAFFVVRAKKNFKFRRLYSNQVDKSLGLRCDQIIKLSGYHPAKHYPDKLRRIKYFDKEKNKLLVFLTNNFEFSASTIADLYKNRWKIELFFKWIKQHLKIKTFYGNSLNAVITQIWIAICSYLLVAIIKKELKIGLNLYTILQILSVSLFEKVPIYQLLSDFKFSKNNLCFDNSLTLFNF